VRGRALLRVLLVKRGQLRQLHAEGFDTTTTHRGPRIGGRRLTYYRPACSQCAALVINGVACHERGCPNTPKGGE
jgi:hypothetical protein